ncbi:hypothetical protein [Nocardia farcinica]|uniref:hypothetical protein n=1 Tax=Nocardia farcinica TaxID=37329 RepID=UPI001895CD34|nr:hypothetical protein [Nocardia farcinica]MBF6071695.1 hypothetical protein [Nocardia farcinica]
MSGLELDTLSCGKDFVAGDWYVLLDAVQIDRCAATQLVGPNRSFLVRRCVSCRAIANGGAPDSARPESHMRASW